MACGRACLPAGVGVDLPSGVGASFLFPSGLQAMAGSVIFFLSLFSFLSFLSFLSFFSFLLVSESVDSSSVIKDPWLEFVSEAGSSACSGSGWGWGCGWGCGSCTFRAYDEISWQSFFSWPGCPHSKHVWGWSLYRTDTRTFPSIVLNDWGMFRCTLIFIVLSPVFMLVPLHITWWGPDTISPKFRNMACTLPLPTSRGMPRTLTQVPQGNAG